MQIYNPFQKNSYTILTKSDILPCKRKQIIKTPPAGRQGVVNSLAAGRQVNVL